MRLLISPPFDSPIAPAMLLPSELAAILAEHHIEVVCNPARADLELVGGVGRGVLPRSRQVLIDGEPPQPEYMLPHYYSSVAQKYAKVMTPASRDVYDADCMAFYMAPLPLNRPRPAVKQRKIVQLATFRTVGGRGSWRVLCALRAAVGLRVHDWNPELIDIYGQGWPSNVSKGCTRHTSDFLDVRTDVSAQYMWDLCWENVQISNYVSEKFWSPLQAGTLPLYFGPDNFHDILPPYTIVDCRRYMRGDVFDTTGLVYDITHMSDVEYLARLGRLMSWYHDLPRDAAHRSHIKAAHTLGRALARLAC